MSKLGTVKSPLYRMRMFMKWMECGTLAGVANYFQITLRVVTDIYQKENWGARAESISVLGNQVISGRVSLLRLKRLELLQKALDLVTPEALIAKCESGGDLIKLLDLAGKDPSQGSGGQPIIVQPGAGGSVQVNTGHAQGLQSGTNGNNPQEMTDEQVRAELLRLGVRVQPPVVPTVPDGADPSDVGTPTPPGSGT